MQAGAKAKSRYKEWVSAEGCLPLYILTHGFKPSRVFNMLAHDLKGFQKVWKDSGGVGRLGRPSCPLVFLLQLAVACGPLGSPVAPLKTQDSPGKIRERLEGQLNSKAIKIASSPPPMAYAPAAYSMGLLAARQQQYAAAMRMRDDTSFGTLPSLGGGGGGGMGVDPRRLLYLASVLTNLLPPKY